MLIKQVAGILVFALCATAYSDSCQIGNRIWSYEVEDGAATITGVEPSTGDLEIPSEINGYKAKKIAEKAFSGSAMSSVKINAGMESIGRQAFVDCSALERVELPEGLEEIGLMAFLRCSSLCSIRIPGSVKYLMSGTFSMCTALREVEICDGVEAVGPGFAVYCSGLDVITIPPSVVDAGKIEGYHDSCNLVRFLGRPPKNARWWLSSDYNVIWPPEYNAEWRAALGWEKEVVLEILSSKIRENDPTVLDFDYAVLSPNSTVNVRVLAFENGERSFQYVVRPETFIEGTEANIGDGITANVEHRLSWKIDKDWKVDLAKVKFEILTSDMAQLPLKTMTIPATAKNPAITVATGTYTDTDIFNALLWHYASGVDDLVNVNGYVDATYGYANQVDTTPHRFVDRTTLGNRMEALRYVLNKMGWEPLEGGNLLNYVRKATRKELWYNSGTQNAAILKSTKPANLYIGEKAYCVIDVSGGPSVTSYPVSYLDTEPVNGWGDEYKTTKILLRRVDAGRFMMQNNKEVTFTKPYYMGVFTVTQKQYEQVMGDNPTQVDHRGPMRPVEISWNAIRGDSATYNWPTVKTVDPNTFVGKIQAKTGLNFDLPTEAQWEMACRAGTSSNYGNGGGRDNDLRLMGRSWTGQSADVGLFKPNFWGFYDMHGNIGQWCLDYSEGYNSDPAIDYVGAESGSDRVFRGYFRSSYYDATSFCRVWRDPSNDRYSGYDVYPRLGFRLSRTLAE